MREMGPLSDSMSRATFYFLDPQVHGFWTNRDVVVALDMESGIDKPPMFRFKSHIFTQSHKQ